VKRGGECGDELYFMCVRTVRYLIAITDSFEALEFKLSCIVNCKKCCVTKPLSLSHPKVWMLSYKKLFPMCKSHAFWRLFSLTLWTAIFRPSKCILRAAILDGGRGRRAIYLRYLPMMYILEINCPPRLSQAQ